MTDIETSERKPIIALTGASGYIGHNLLKKLEKQADIIALSRNGDSYENTENVTWRSADLYSLKDAEEALKGADYAVYLVHSMMPSAKLTQAKFEDMDLILADNFAQAAKKNGVKQIIYLSGIIPPDAEELSRHLQSRLEVEKVLSSYDVPVTTIRAGLIVGPKGSSFPIVKKLVKRLPMMLLPKWTRQKTHPIALKDVLSALKGSIGNKKLSGASIDVGGPEVMSYKEMMIDTAEIMGKNRRLVNVPFMTVKLSRLWVSVTTGTPKEMVYPLIESLIHPLVANPDNMDKDLSYGQTPFKEAAKFALEQEEQEENNQPQKEKNSTPTSKVSSSISDVRSVQRVLLPEGKDASWAASRYIHWLEEFGSPFIRTSMDHNHNANIYLFGKKPLLKLTYSNERSHNQRALFYISGGAFAKPEKTPGRGRLEFRQIPNSQECLIAIHEYKPSLPWFLYTITQAKFHLWVMYLFKRHLNKLIKRNNQQPKLIADVSLTE
ncbi:NAD(P)H-binding protein [Alkalicoccobacillus porphyridii]|uniref:NAD-dependent epimerase/dehydratase family protein n=1 Tax=Alkalicoccobacillus porphyridii TaxID=2597270 RepID=A0A554A1P3_9BACI|nr:NAD(P)H-binding protein [Alkalicoccobacillus porphyridii]TSB47605.1 NAD-dependent epimerase/dehydratase family protein [Alkalicoccobacillus porphyridii]